MTEATTPPVAQWTAENAIAMLVAITRSLDATEADKAEARQEILVILGATTGRYDVYQRARARRSLRFAIAELKAPREPRSSSAPVSLRGGGGGTGRYKGARIGKRRAR